MSTWFEVKDKALKDPELKDKPVTERLKIAGERWRKITGKPKATASKILCIPAPNPPPI